MARVYVDDTFAATLDGDLRQFRQCLAGTARYTQQHRQIYARHACHALGMTQLPRDIAWRGAEYIR